MKATEIVDKIRKDYAMIGSLAVMDFNEKYDEEIELLCMRYDGKKDILATDAQISFLNCFKNIDYYGDLNATNRYALSACIQIAKDYPSQLFHIEVP